MRYVIVDLEATCWENNRNTDRMEIIEIGAVLLPSCSALPTAEFSRFVRPVVEPRLSDFCRKLTSISQADVDAADTFWTVLGNFLDWIGPEPFVLCSWGAYDLNQFRVDCQRHGIPFPETFGRHVNLKKEFARVFKVRRCGMVAALQHAGLPLEGRHHRGIDDARNIAKLARLVLPQLEHEGVISVS
jgi:inhibitor of KinA sporulation pathway (predicted exonuclease)